MAEGLRAYLSPPQNHNSLNHVAFSSVCCMTTAKQFTQIYTVALLSAETFTGCLYPNKTIMSRLHIVTPCKEAAVKCILLKLQPM